MSSKWHSQPTMSAVLSSQMGLGSKTKESFFYKDWIQKKIYRGQNQKYHILHGGKTLLTLFSLSGEDVPSSDNLIWGTCFINDAHLIAIIDTGATHSFISLDCVKRLNLEVSLMSGSMVIDIPASGLVTSTIFCQNCPLSIWEGF